MRLRSKMIRNSERRRGMSFVEIVLTTVMVAMLMSIVIGMLSIVRMNMRDTLSYSAMKTFAVNKIEQIQIDLEGGKEIDTIDYNEIGDSADIHANVTVRDVGTAFGAPLYHVEISMKHVDTGNITTTQTTLRKGCLAYVP